MYKAIFIDLDGTLLRSDHSVSPASIRAIQQLKEKGLLIVLVSARPLHGMQSIIENTGLEGYPVAALNGALITRQNDILFQATIGLETVGQIHRRLTEFDPTVIYYEATRWFAEVQNQYTEHEQEITEIPVTVLPFDSMLDSWLAADRGPGKILAISKPDAALQVQSGLKEQFDGRVNISMSKPTYVEIMNLQASKLNALRFIMSHYNIRREETLAIGDNYNDAEMIAYAGQGVAMGNAPEEVKARASYITSSNNNDGVAAALTQFLGLRQ